MGDLKRLVFPKEKSRSNYSSLASILNFLAGGPEGTSESVSSEEAVEGVEEDPDDPPAEAKSLAADGSIITSLTEKREGLNLTITAVYIYIQKRPVGYSEFKKK